jgi:catechol 2,3-dioxygenase-like lactoylglutathione lyase family enzyme
MGIKYTHTNIIARDWRALSGFYIRVFACKLLPPERNLSGKWIDRMTGIDNVHVRGVHLQLPGFGDGPTLEIFQYEPEYADIAVAMINRPGYGHIAFHVDDVEEVLAILIEQGGSQLGEVVKRQYETLGLLTAVYAQDPEGNIIEIQNWQK